MAFALKTLESFGVRTTLIRIGSKLRSNRYQCSLCGVMVGRDSSACSHCGADLR